MLGELESDGLKATEGGTPWRRAAALWTPLSARTALVALAGMAAVSVGLRIVFARQVQIAFFFMDELGYEQMAKSFARTGHLALFGKTGSAYGPLYPIVLSPVYALTSSAHAAWEWSKVVNSVLMSLSVFPAYAIARFVLSRPRALGVAALSAIAPLMFYADLELSENLAYPLCLVAIWAMLRAVRSPSLRNDALLLGAIALASAARLQQVALFPAALTAVLLVAVVRPEHPGQGSLRAATRAVARHMLLFGSVAVAVVAVLARTAANGGSLPLAGRYASIGSAHAGPIRVLELAFQHLAELDFALGILPFAGAMLAAYALVRLGFPRDQLVFASVAVAFTAWLLLEVGFDAAAFDHAGSVTAAPRIHERYLIYLVPLFLVALVAALRVSRPRVGSIPHVAVAATAALLPAAIPFSSVVNYTIPVESFGLQIFGTDVRGTIAPIPHPGLVAMAIGGVLALTYLYALLRPRPSFAIVMTVIAFLMLSSLVRIRLNGAAQTTYKAVPNHTAWVDNAVRGGQVALVSRTSRTDIKGAAVWSTAFTNLTISRVYSMCSDGAFGSDFGEKQLSIGQGGVLVSDAGVVHAAYAVVPTAFNVRGRVLAKEAREGLVLVAPAGGVLTVPPSARSAARCIG